MSKERIDNILNHLCDNESKTVFLNRLAYTKEPSMQNLRVLTGLSEAPVINTIDAFIKLGNKVCIYGVGYETTHPGRALCRLFFDHLAGVYDQNASSIKVAKGYGMRIPVQEPEKILEAGEDIIVVVTAANPKYQAEIFTKLTYLGIPAWRILFLPAPLFDFNKIDYFSFPFLTYTDEEVFIDCGCYDGATAKLFADVLKGLSKPLPKKVIAYEPNTAQFTICRENTNDLPFVEIRPFGVWDKTETIGFIVPKDASAGLRIDQGGEETLQVVALDDNLKDEKVTFIKMDIEGAEMEALRGAERIIKANRPKLAICVYHKPADLFEIPEYIINLGLNYNLYMRHQSLWMWDTVLYAVPK